MTKATTVFSALLIMVTTSSALAQTVDPVEELKACGKMTDPEARLACFDDLAERVLEVESTDQEPMPASAAQSEVSDMSELEDDQERSYSGIVTSCQEGQYGDWYFFFDNGQVWKYTGNRKLRFKECNFNVTVSRDFFGFKMQGDGLESDIRIRRHR